MLMTTRRRGITRYHWRDMESNDKIEIRKKEERKSEEVESYAVYMGALSCRGFITPAVP